MSFTLNKLTEGIRDRHVGQQNKRLVEKWSRTGLLRGMEEVNRENMATLLENQAAQVLRESSTMTSGDVAGFSNIAFPIVRRVFGGLVANELVSIQPMSLPSGLLFYLDYTYGSDAGDGAFKKDQSIYGQPSGRDIQEGAQATGGQYDLVGSGFSRVHARVEHPTLTLKASDRALVSASSIKAGEEGLLHRLGCDAAGEFEAAPASNVAKLDVTNEEHLKLIQFDSQIIDDVNNSVADYFPALVKIEHNSFAGIDETLITSLSVGACYFGAIAADAVDNEINAAQSMLSEQVPTAQQGGDSHNVRRLTRLGKLVNKKFVATPQATRGADVYALVILRKSTGDLAGQVKGVLTDADLAADDGANDTMLRVSFVKADAAEATANRVGEIDIDPAFESDFANNPSPVIPEIDIKIESIPVTAQTRKLRARWSPELAQDLNAYHSMDAEVELTQILSEQIALEIDREILGDLLNGAQGANFFWSRSPGKFVNKRTGSEIARTSTLTPGPAFTGTVREWYETLTETIIDVANEIHRKTLRGSANFIVVSPDVATILEASVLYRPSYSIDGDGQVGAPFTMGAEKVGTLSNRFTVYKDPYFPRNKVLVGYKGGSYLETGFVYAPYVPLIVTPTIFQPEDFTPRKGVMTRYGKKMVRADFYGTVTCLDMNII